MTSFREKMALRRRRSSKERLGAYRQRVAQETDGGNPIHRIAHLVALFLLLLYHVAAQGEVVLVGLIIALLLVTLYVMVRTSFGRVTLTRRRTAPPERAASRRPDTGRFPRVFLTDADKALSKEHPASGGRPRSEWPAHS